MKKKIFSAAHMFAIEILILHSELAIKIPAYN